jgi:hypothetical protein
MINVSQRDKGVLRELGARVAEIAALPVQQEQKARWRALNRLEPERPMVLIDQIPWHEMNVEDELTLRCEDNFCRLIEDQIRQTLYKWSHIRCDMVVEPWIELEKVYCNHLNGRLSSESDAGERFIYMPCVDAFGIEILEETVSTDAANQIVSHHFFDQLQTEADLDKIRMPDLRIEPELTAERERAARDVFAGVLEVKSVGFVPYFAPWDWIVEWRGAEQSLLDLAERPDFVHALMDRLTRAHLILLEQLEREGLLDHAPPLVHCSGSYTDEPMRDGAAAKNNWTFGMAQIFSSVSPAMREEFDLHYAHQWYRQFRLVYYGCCEPLHHCIDRLRQIPNLRKVSISPWADAEKAAQEIGSDYVFSRKPSPAFLATDGWDAGSVREDLGRIVKAADANNCPLEFILKDISTVRYEPQRLWNWADMAMEAVGA